MVSSVSTRPCEGRGAGANPAKGTIFKFMHKAKRPATALQPQATRCESEVHVHFSTTDTRESANPLGLGPRDTEGNTMPRQRQFKLRSLTVKAKPTLGCPTISSFILHLFIPPCSSTAEHRTLTPNVPVRLRPGLPTFHSWKSNRTSVPERSRKPNVPHAGMGSMSSDFRQLHSCFRSSIDRAPRFEREGCGCSAMAR